MFGVVGVRMCVLRVCVCVCVCCVGLGYYILLHTCVCCVSMYKYSRAQI